MVDLDDSLFAELFALGDGEGAVQMTWEQASRCACYAPDTKQPRWDCPSCGGNGVQYAPAVLITGLFRAQSRWLSFRREGELDHGEAQLTTPLSVQPGYQDRRVRDRLSVPAAGDTVFTGQLVPRADLDPAAALLPGSTGFVAGRVFYPAAPAVPFIFSNVQRAWRVQLQSADRSEQLVP